MPESNPQLPPRPEVAGTVGEAAEAGAWVADAETLSLAPRPVGTGTPMERVRGRGAPVKPLSHRDDLVIPDYTLLKRIGSGAYGEVWLAQSVTGALRAVKIVWREDFELTRTFHREFEGIQQFEPISRGHPCLVHILHVGWNENRGFYYCVMELADDAEKGAQIDDLATYTPRTLSSDMKKNGRLDLHFCRESGMFMADALAFMHDHGLTHRDIKPSNVIFVGAMCKLADIGLVAASGERTFVGTEGFVPPEGPGTPQADIYSLGKVLYEMSSGNDRMEFPEVPGDLRDDEWELWMDLNRVICRACAPDLKERFSSAGQFKDALQAVGQKRPEPFLRRFTRAAVLLMVGSAMAGGALVMARQEQSWSYQVALPARPAQAVRATPQPPQDGRPWKSRFGKWFSYQKDRHVSDLPLEFEIFNRYLDATLMPFEGDVVNFAAPGNAKLNVVLIAPSDADAFCAWATDYERRSGYLDADHEYSWAAAALKQAETAPASRDGLGAVRPQIVKVPVGRLRLTSTPEGAEVWNGQALLGRTPLELPNARAGRFAFEMRLPGYAAQMVRGEVKEGGESSAHLRLRASGAVVFGKPWQNSLGMKLVPLGQAMLAVTETRQGDFEQFARSTGIETMKVGEARSESGLPATRVSRLDAALFCRWLTERERALGLLLVDHEYRLPTDDEWSMAAYLPRERGTTPAERNLRIEGIYPWGFIWPPYAKQGNYADKSADPSGKQAVPGYQDGFATAAPVGSFKSDSRGLSDLSGNVWEWVADDWSEESDDGVARGGSYLTFERRELLASFRLRLPADSRLPDVGFRILLAVEGRLARDDD